jgi:hypothetical protein
MPYIDLSEDQFYWLGVAVAEMKAQAENLSPTDVEDTMDQEQLVHTWTELQAIFPEPEISDPGRPNSP